MVGGKRRREGSQKRAIRRLRDRDNFHRLSIGARRVAEVLDGRRSQHEDRHELLARKLQYPRGSGCVSGIDQSTKLGEVTVGWRYRKSIGPPFFCITPDFLADSVCRFSLLRLRH